MGNGLTDIRSTMLGPVDGVIVTSLRQISDYRGAVLHMIRSDSPNFPGFGECYFSEILTGEIKAWKRHRAQIQNLAVPMGRIRLVIFDGRDTSPSAGSVQIIEVGRPDAYVRVSIPPALWYGFRCISATSALLANCTDLPHDPTESEARAWDDPAIPYSWK